MKIANIVIKGGVYAIDEDGEQHWITNYSASGAPSKIFKNSQEVKDWIDGSLPRYT